MSLVVTHFEPSTKGKLWYGNHILKQIKHELRLLVPKSGILESEIIHYPKSGENSDCSDSNVVHIDSFLYDDDDLETLCDLGQLHRYRCRDCGSNNIETMSWTITVMSLLLISLKVFLSHSASFEDLLYVFCDLLPDLKGMKILDVGSRLGCVLYGAYVFSNAPKIIGIEMNQDFCQIQETIIAKYNMQDRIEIRQGLITEFEDVVGSSDVFIFNNVFEFFVDRTQEAKIWRFLFQNIKSGSLLVTRPALSKSFDELDLDVDDYVIPIEPNNSAVLEEKELPDFMCYQVK